MTVVLSYPSRFDNDPKNNRLLSGYAGDWFLKECLGFSYPRESLDIRTADTKGEPLLPDTKLVLLLGDLAKKIWLPHLNEITTLGQQRGTHEIIDGIIYMVTFFPQDAMDMKDYESTHNQAKLKALESYESLSEEDSDEDSEDAGAEKTRHGKTKRSNYRFWIEKDVKKLFRLIGKYGRIIGSVNSSKHDNSNIHNSTIFCPSVKVACDLLYSITPQESLYLDIETSIENQTLTCIGLGIGDRDIIVIPVYDYRNVVAYSNIHEIFLALAYAIENCLDVTTHNGHCFDLYVLTHKYRLPLPRRNYDTMIAHQRCFPEVERSLGHCISLWTDEGFHKNDGIYQPRNSEQERQLWEYNAKDVITMRKVRKSIDKYAEGVPGLKDSIQQAMDSIYPYLLTTFTGILFDDEKRQSTIRENDKMMMLLMRVAGVLMGEEILDRARTNSKGQKTTSPFPGSNAQCVRYLHGIMNYPVISKSDKTGSPSLGGKNLLKLRLKEECRGNLVLDIILKYRELSKESSTLKFIPMWER